MVEKVLQALEKARHGLTRVPPLHNHAEIQQQSGHELDGATRRPGAAAAAARRRRQLPHHPPHRATRDRPPLHLPPQRAPLQAGEEVLGASPAHLPTVRHSDAGDG